MVRILRAALIAPGAPNPSVETLLHAFLPHKFIDHTHATAVLSLADQPDAVERCADVYRGRLGIVPYVMPGLPLGKKAAEIFEADPSVEGLVLIKHGIVAFGDTARDAYERMIAAVTEAETRLSGGRRHVFPAAALPSRAAPTAEVAPIVRGACALAEPAGAWKRFVLDFRTTPAVLNFVNGAELQRYGVAGVATPDHTIRTKNYPLIAPPPSDGLDQFAVALRQKVADFAAGYRAYFARNNAASAIKKRELDPMPRVVLLPGLGLFGLGRSAHDAAIAADIAESWIETATDAEAIGRFESLSEAELFGMEYWSLE
jgi:rhamnose utilization protein RhaD (predicted bifunctional aldolase and dehydrogenase)